MTFGRGHSHPGQLVNWPSGVRRYDLSADGRWFTIKIKFACLQLKEVGGLKVDTN